MDKEEKRKIWRDKFEAWWAAHIEKHKIKPTKDNPNAVAIGCWLNPDAQLKDDPERRYV